MRYVISILADVDYGVSLEQLRRIFQDELDRVVGSSTENFIKAWECGSLWLYETKQSEIFPSKYLTADELNYIVYEDGSKGHNNIAYGWATFIENEDNAQTTHPIYGKGYYNWKDAFAAEGIVVETLATGSYVDKAAADSVFHNEILPFFKNRVETYLEEHLPEYTFSRQQKDALISIAYQYGNIAGFAEAYIKSLNPDGTVDAEKIKDNYSRFYYTTTVNNRCYANFLLFTEGTYIDRDGVKINLGGTIVEAAYEVADHFNNSGVDIHYAGASVDRATNNGRKVNGQNIRKSWELPIQQPNKYGIVCATYVALAVWRSGLIDEETINQYYYHGTGGMDHLLKESKYAEDWEIIENWDDLQEGDIVQMEGHIFIYMDGEKCLDQHYCAISSNGKDLRGRLLDAKSYRYQFYHAFRYKG